MSEELNDIVRKAFTDAVSSISQTNRQPEEFKVVLLHTEDCMFETFRIMKICETADMVGEHGIAWTRWLGKDLTDIVWTFDGNTDLLWSNHNNSALYYTDWKDRYSQPQEQMEVVTEEPVAGIFSGRCELCGYFGGKHDIDCKNNK